jgi:hypothetical protein
VAEVGPELGWPIAPAWCRLRDMWKAVALVGGTVALVLLVTRESKDARATSTPPGPKEDVCEFGIEMFNRVNDMSLSGTNTLLRVGTRADTNAALAQFQAEAARRNKEGGPPAHPGCADGGCGWRFRRSCYPAGTRGQVENYKIDILAHV